MRYSFLLALASAMALAGRMDAQYTLEADLDEEQSGQPLCCFGGHGHGTFLLDPVANTLNFDITSFVSGIGGGEEEAHFHIGAPGQFDPIIRFTLPPGAHKVGVWNYHESLEQSILQGFLYVDIHTLEGPGSLRGQVVLLGVPALPTAGLVVLVVLAIAGGIVLIRRAS